MLNGLKLSWWANLEFYVKIMTPYTFFVCSFNCNFKICVS